MTAIPVIEMRLADVKIGERHRRDLGDIPSLAASMDRLGLLHPIGVTRDRTLLFGERRLHAARSLGWETIPVRVLDVDKLDAEHDENELHKAFTVSERVAIAKAIEERIGNRHGQRTDKELPENIPEVSPGTETRRTAALAAGFGNETTYRQAKAVVTDGSPELVEAMDREEVTVSRAAQIVVLPAEQQGGEVAKARGRRTSARTSRSGDGAAGKGGPSKTAEGISADAQTVSLCKWAVRRKRFTVKAMAEGLELSPQACRRFLGMMLAAVGYLTDALSEGEYRVRRAVHFVPADALPEDGAPGLLDLLRELHDEAVRARRADCDMGTSACWARPERVEFLNKFIGRIGKILNA